MTGRLFVFVSNDDSEREAETHWQHFNFVSICC